jgi:hypothetical protein
MWPKPIFCQNKHITFYRRKSSHQVWADSIIVKKQPKQRIAQSSGNSPNRAKIDPILHKMAQSGEKFAQSGRPDIGQKCQATEKLGRMTVVQGCQIFPGTSYQNGKNIDLQYTKSPHNLPIGRKMDQMVIKYANISNCKALQNLPKLTFLF